MAKAKDERAAMEKSVAAFILEMITDAKETKTTVQFSGLSKSYGWAVLSGASAAGQQ